ncbi:MAG TPA: recombinase family protein, partial [Acetobacteraceae bacterium]|nr:recombinase family protein [Acetobacteraceae bacterium]
WIDVEVIDEDLGRSGSGVIRPGFERLLIAVCEGRVGAVMTRIVDAVLVDQEAHARARSMITATAEVRDAHGNLIPPPPPAPSQAQRWVQVAEHCNDVADMLIFAGRANNWFDIYKALELAQLLAGGRPGRKLNALLGGASDEFERMWRTANMHRHARSNDAPTTPMALADAMSLLPSVIRTLLAHLAP